MLAFLRARAFNRGVLGGNRFWIGIGAVVWTIRLFQWLTRPETSVIYRDRLGAGQSVVITHNPTPPTRRQAKKAKKTEKAATKAAKKADRKARKADRKLPSGSDEQVAA